MKKRILMLLLVLALVLSACGGEKVRTVEYRGTTFTLDTENQTITHDGMVYQYETDGTAYTITYPDGATYTMTWSGAIGTGGGSGLYYEASHLDGGLLIDMLREQQPKQKNPANFVWGLVLIAFGIFNAAVPYAAWYVSRGWYYKDAEPSDAALAVTRAGGIVVIILGIILLFL